MRVVMGSLLAVVVSVVLTGELMAHEVLVDFSAREILQTGNPVDIVSSGLNESPFREPTVIQKKRTLPEVGQKTTFDSTPGLYRAGGRGFLNPETDAVERNRTAPVSLQKTQFRVQNMPFTAQDFLPSRIPEPATMALLGLGLVGLARVARRLQG